MKNANFYWISITGCIPVTLRKRQLDQNPILGVPELCNVRGWHQDIGKRPLLACSRNAGGWYKLFQIIENLSSCTSRCICDLLGMRAVERTYPRLVDNSTASAFGAYAVMTKMQAVQVGTMEQSIRRAGGQALVWILLYSLHHKIRAIVPPEDSHSKFQRNYCYIVSLVTYPIINPYVDILIWSYPEAGYEYAPFCLWFMQNCSWKLYNSTFASLIS